MHLLAATPGTLLDGSTAVDLGQSAGEIVVLSAADSEIRLLAAAHGALAVGDRSWPTLRLANLLALSHNLSVDTYVEATIAQAKLVVVRLLGGRGYWTYGVDEIARVCGERGMPVAFIPGDDKPDDELARLSTLPGDICETLWRYLLHGGRANAESFLKTCARIVGRAVDAPAPQPLARAGGWHPKNGACAIAEARVGPARPLAAILFYRALLQADDLAPVAALVEALNARGVGALPVFLTSLRDESAFALVRAGLEAARPDVVIATTSFARGSPNGEGSDAHPLGSLDCPVIQAVLASCDEESWRAGTRGLPARDIAMAVALPEVDGRIVSRAISFKSTEARDAATEAPMVVQRPVGDRIDFVADVARNWARLRTTPRNERRVALILANYPNRDSRIANGVGLDTPASVGNIVRALDGAGYAVADAPTDSRTLMATILAAPTNQARRQGGVALSLADYRAFFATLPPTVRETIAARWGEPESDPMVADGAFHLPMQRFGNLAIGVQPARGYNIDPASSYHDPALPPPHSYLAFYAWLRTSLDAHAVVHVGKHGNLEWLPGKGIALSEDCFPEAALGPLPHLYPFIVNDPGEGTQAKRRAQAVIVDHLTPPFTRAESYGALAELERLVDEYYEAARMDPRRTRELKRAILDRADSLGLVRDAGLSDPDAALAKLDGYLCELKEMQIRGGLHVFGESPDGDALTDLLVALARLPRVRAGRARAEDESLLRALARDLGLDFDPLMPEPARDWKRPRPPALADVAGPWRSEGDTVERLESLARELVSGRRAPDETWSATRAVLDAIARDIRPRVTACGDRELAALLAGLDGRFVPSGPSGAPTRGRIEALPTGRNFYSVDSRALPTPAAWRLGFASAQALVERHAQEHGDYPRAVALSAWGTSNMRTGGDDIAQALALIGAQPTWDTSTGRVTGFDILPASVLGRPRVDVTLRVSGFFRDAFPGLIALFDSAVRAVAELDEPESTNPIAAAARRDEAALVAQGATPQTARQRALYRVFGSKPGAYGAGLQTLIDEGGWNSEGDLARAFRAWSAYAYGAGIEGVADAEAFDARVARVDAVLHNQDNREHDILDSDDYYQFAGGLTAAVAAARGERPAVYLNDHSRPETPRIRTLAEEIGRVVRARAANPKWIAGVMKHGYKGAFEMAATVDYLFAFAATTGAVADHHFGLLYDAYLADERVRDFIAENNPAALTDMAARLVEAIDRGLWRPRANAVHDDLARLTGRGVAETSS
ncbi:MAG: cobaltochelatase subunit CobN [Gemmatimonas sp.]